MTKPRPKNPDWRVKHGHNKKGHMTPEYRAWLHMKVRCNWERDRAYHHYGGRGIKVCPRWEKSFVAFLEDMGLRPSPKHSLGRIDNEKGYSPENCRWETRTQQMRNTRRNRFLTFKGKTQTVSEWAVELGMEYGTLSARLLKGWSVEAALSTPVRVDDPDCCRKGHPFNEENTYIYYGYKNRPPQRQCRACHREAAKDRRTTR